MAMGEPTFFVTVTTQAEDMLMLSKEDQDELYEQQLNAFMKRWFREVLSGCRPEIETEV